MLMLTLHSNINNLRIILHEWRLFWGEDTLSHKMRILTKNVSLSIILHYFWLTSAFGMMYNEEVMRVYSFIKDLLLFGILGFLIVPVKFIFWIFSQEGRTVLFNLPSYLKGGENVSLMPGLILLFRAVLWSAIALGSLFVFSFLAAHISGIAEITPSYITPPSETVNQSSNE